MSEGKFYWIKLKEDFFDSDVIQWIEEQPNGKEYVLFYLKLCLKSLKNDGMLVRTVGDMLIPYSPEKLAALTNTSVDTVITAMMILTKTKLVELLDDGTYKVPSVVGAVGTTSKNSNALRQARYREKHKSVTKSNALSNGSNVTDHNVEIDIENRDIEKEIDISSSSSNNYISKSEEYNLFQDVERCLKIPMTSFLAEKFKALEEEVGTGVLHEALEETAKYGGRSYAYVETVARRIANGGGSKKTNAGAIDWDEARKRILGDS